MAVKKPADRRHNRHTSDLAPVVVMPGTANHLPVASVDWADEVQQAWGELASSPLAQHYRPTDLPSLRRLFDLRDRLISAQRKFDEDPVVAGSMGQQVMSPWAVEVHRLEAEIQKLEDRFGLTPLSRLRLGVTYEEGVSLAGRNAQLLAAFKQSGAGDLRASGGGVD